MTSQRMQCALVVALEIKAAYHMRLLRNINRNAAKGQVMQALLAVPSHLKSHSLTSYKLFTARVVWLDAFFISGMAASHASLSSPKQFNCSCQIVHKSSSNSFLDFAASPVAS